MAGLTENRGVRQRPEEGFRRWFLNEYFELIIWYDRQGGDVTGFQLCLDRNRFERAFTWTKEYASTHFVSDAYVEKGVSHLATGILKGAGRTVSAEETQRLIAEKGELDDDLLAFVVEKIEGYNVREGRRLLPQ